MHAPLSYLSKNNVIKSAGVVLHTGDIDIRNNAHYAEKDMLNAIDEVLSVFPSSRVLISTPSAQVLNVNLKNRVKDLIKKLKHRCEKSPELTLINTANLPLRDGIHFTKPSMEEFANQIARTINYM